MTILAIAISAVVIGLLLLGFGLRGKQIAGSRMCGRCRFDLAGITPSICPECGAALGLRRAIVPKRIRSRVMIWCGAAVVLISATAAGTLGWALATKFDVLPHLPAWAVRMEARATSEARSLRALDEFARRMKAGTLLDEDVQFVADNAIARVQARDEPPIDWSEFIEFARASGQLSDEKWLAYAKAVIDVELSVREKARKGETVKARIGLIGRRVSRSAFSGPARMLPRAQLRIKQWMEEGRVGTLITKGSSGVSSTRTVQRGSSGGMGMRLKSVDALGPSSLHVTIRLELLNENDTKVIGGWSLEFARPLEIIGADEPMIRENKDVPQDVIRQSIVVRGAKLRDNAQASIDIDFNGPPSGLGFEVIVRPLDGPGRAEMAFGQIGIEQGNTISQSIGNALPSNTATRVDVILRPSRQAAEANPCVQSVWIGPEIVFRDVQLRWER